MRQRLRDQPSSNPFVYAVLTKKGRKLMTVWRARKTADQYIKKFGLSKEVEVKEVHLYDVVDLRNMKDGRTLFKTRQRLKEN